MKTSQIYTKTHSDFNNEINVESAEILINREWVLKLSIIVVLFFLSMQGMFAQYSVDAIILSEDKIDGNARYVGTGGAMGAVGANLSSICTNPAGTAVYDKGEFGISIGFGNMTVDSKYFDESTQTSTNKFTLPNIGVAVNLYESEKTPLTKLNFAFTINKTGDFNRKMNFWSQNFSSSIMDDMLYEYLYGENLPTYSNLAYTTNAIYPDDNGNMVTVFDYFEDSINVRRYGEDQYKSVSNFGSKREFTFSFGAEFHKKLLFGLNISIDNIDYEYQASHIEKGNYDTNVEFGKIKYNENYSMMGVGYSASLGILVKPIKSLSFGGAVHTSSKYRIYEDYNYTFYNESNIPDSWGNYSYEDSYHGDAEYNFTTPLKLTANIAYIFKNIAFVDFDYERTNYSKVNYESIDGDEFAEVNQVISENYGASNTFRLGGEIRYGSVSFRAGYAMLGDALSSSVNDFNKNISGGIGIRGEKLYFDAAYTYSMYPNVREQFMYVDYDGYDVTGTYTQNTSQVVLTLGVKF